MPTTLDELIQLQEEIVSCEACPRLVAFRQAIAQTKRRAYRDDEYWGRPVPSFGDPYARLVIVGLAPAAHGGNRTGRLFTGDRSGDWLYRALFRAGFANQPQSRHRHDGLTLSDAYITAACHCAPPQNQPTREELATCRRYLVREFELLTCARVFLCLGQIAFQATLTAWQERGAGLPEPVEAPPGRQPRFQHGALYRWSNLPEQTQPVWLLASYHPSQRNTQTGLLTEEMFDAILRRARDPLDQHAPNPAHSSRVVSSAQEEQHAKSGHGQQ